MITLLAALVAPAFATAGQPIRIAAQKTGTLAWELDVIRRHGLDRKAGLELAVTELASPEAGKIALKGGSADIIVSDWLWVARERAAGGRLVIAPYSSTLGAVMVPAGSRIKSVADLKGAKLAVAGGPLDKSWVLLRALALKSGLDLKKGATLIFGAPPLLSQKAIQGETDATLTYWNFAASLERQGFARAIDMGAVQAALGASAPVAMLGYAFDGVWGERHRAAVDAFLGIADEAKRLLASEPAEWAPLASRIGAVDAATIEVMRSRYADGIPKRATPQMEGDVQRLFKVLAETGGPELVGPDLAPGRSSDVKPLPTGLFWAMKTGS